MNHVALLALFAVCCTANQGVRLVGATPAQQDEAFDALAELRVDTGGAVDRYVDDDGSTVVTLDPQPYGGGDGPGNETGSEGRGDITIYPLGQGELFRVTLVHEVLHDVGLRHVVEGPAVMAPARRSVRSCLRAEDVAEFCRVRGCMHVALPEPCTDEPSSILGAP